MISLLGSILGLFSSIGPGMFKQWMAAKQDKRDKAFELEMQRQISADKRDEATITGITNQNISVQTTAQAEMKNASRWAVNYAAGVRPTLTYLIFALFAAIHAAAFADWLTPEEYQMIMAGGAVEGTFSTVIMFWFGQRLTSKWTR